MREKIRTFSGIHMSPADPRPEEICIEDIAHALSLMTRANGHFPVFYSVKGGQYLNGRNLYWRIRH